MFDLSAEPARNASSIRAKGPFHVLPFRFELGEQSCVKPQTKLDSLIDE